MRIVVDTNLIASAIFFGGLPYKLAELILEDKITDDDKFLECAIDGVCTHIVSGDKDLLVLQNYGDIKIIKVRDFFNE